MSGGSFNYLYTKELEHYVSYQVSQDDIEEMIAELYELSPLVANEYEQLWKEAIAFRDKWEARMKPLIPVLHDVEWWRSFDIGKDQVDLAIAKYIVDMHNKLVDDEASN